MTDEPMCKWCGEPIGEHTVASAVWPDTLKGYTWTCPNMPKSERPITMDDLKGTNP